MWTGESLVATVNHKVLHIYVKHADMNALHPLSRRILLALNKKTDKRFQLNSRICELNIVSRAVHPNRIHTVIRVLYTGTRTVPSALKGTYVTAVYRIDPYENARNMV